MTEPIFKAPLPSENNGFTPPPPPEKSEDVPSAEPAQDIKQKILPYLWYVLGGAFFIGFLMGIMMSGGEDSTQPVQDCPLKFVRNPDIQKSFPLCGRTSKTNECVLFIMNTTRYDAYAEDFFEKAGQLTERSRYLISTDNPTYSKLNIPPGYFAQIKIPSLR